MRLFEWGGSWSYSLYLLHMFLLDKLSLLPFANYWGSMAWFTKITLALLLNYLFYRGVEQPAHDIARWLCRRRQLHRSSHFAHADLIMNLHYFQHVPFEGLGSIEAWALSAGHRVSATRFHERDPLPALHNLDWLIVMGGPMSVHDESELPWLVEEKRFIEQAVNGGKTVLGICLGAQLIATVLGAKVYRNRQKEIGWFPIQRTAGAAEARIATTLPDQLEAFHWHGETFDLPAGAVHLARSEACENQAFAYGDRVLALQFHLETTPESAGALIEHCGDELVPGPFIQTGDAMLAQPERFQVVNEVMSRLLCLLTEAKS